MFPSVNLNIGGRDINLELIRLMKCYPLSVIFYDMKMLKKSDINKLGGGI